MPTSVIDLCNRALGRIGITQLIEDIDDPNERARQARIQYTPCRDEVMQDFPWNFAQSFVQLAPIANLTVPGWRYAYAYPDSCLRLQQITDESGARLFVDGGYYASGCEIIDYARFNVRRMPFSIMNDPNTVGARIVVTDMDGAYAWFTQLIEDPNQFSPLFRSALSWRMAMELGLSLRVDTRLQSNAAEQYIWTVSQAQAGSLNEQRTDRYPDSPAIQARM